MCLLERVLSVDNDTITCGSHTHLLASNPLRYQGRLSAVHLCEYGAQATAVHGALSARMHEAPAPGWLVALRDVKLNIEYLDECPVLHTDNELRVTATRQHASATGCMYEFVVSMGSQQLVSGKATIMTRSDT